MNRITACAVLCYCAFPAFAQQSSTQPAKRSLGLDAFAAICLATAPDFSKTTDKAAAFGIELIGDGSVKDGMTEDKSLTASVKSNGCTITTESQRNRKLSEEFRALVAEFTGIKQTSKFPFKIQIGGKDFLVMHDRNDGEAFVLLGL
jgi:hypothetical protein